MLQNRSLLPKVEVLSPKGDKTSICCIKLLQSVLNFYYHKITKKCRLKGGKFRNGAPCGEDHGVGGARAVAYGWQHGEQAKRGGGRFG